jgi:hypothetical protein
MKSRTVLRGLNCPLTGRNKLTQRTLDICARNTLWACQLRFAQAEQIK